MLPGRGHRVNVICGHSAAIDPSGDHRMNRLARAVIAAALAATVVLPVLAPAALAQDRRVRIHNNTGYTLYRFYSTDSGSTRWGRDVMGSSVLRSGSSMVLNFDNRQGYCLFDFKAVFEDGDELTSNRVNVCEVADYYYRP